MSWALAAAAAGAAVDVGAATLCALVPVPWPRLAHWHGWTSTYSLGNRRARGPPALQAPGAHLTASTL